MQVTSLLKQVQLCLIAHEELMTAVADVDSRRVDLISLTHTYTADITTDIYRD